MFAAYFSYAVTVWYMDKTEREQAKLDHLQEGD